MRGTRIFIASSGTLELGHGTYINDHAMITCYEHIKIGSGVAVSWYVQILDSDVHQVVLDGAPQPRTKPVHIADRVWLGLGAIVLKGVSIEADAVVGAGAVVANDIAPQSLVAGNPARTVHTNVSWNR